MKISIVKYILLTLVLLLLTSPQTKAAIQFQDKATSFVNGSTTFTATIPYNVTSEVLIAVINLDNVSPNSADHYRNPTITNSPTGWVKIIDNSFYGIDIHRSAWYKLTPETNSTVSWTFDLSVKGEITILRYSGVDLTTPITNSSFRNDWQKLSSHLTNPINVDFANSLVVGCWFASDFSSSFTLTFNSNPLANSRENITGDLFQPDRGLLIGDEIVTSTGSFGAKTAYTNHNTFGQSVVLVLKEAT